jgi:hypothetical protein
MGQPLTSKLKKKQMNCSKQHFLEPKKVRGIGSQDAQGTFKQRKMEQFKKNDSQV